MAKVDSSQRMDQLAAIAHEVKDLPVHTQFRVLGAAGLKLSDINWENCVSNPGLPVSRIPTTRDGEGSEKKP